MSKTRDFAQSEFNILRQAVPDAAILPFESEILALCDKFGKSGQSGGSAPYIATAISKAVKKLLLQEIISPILNDNISDWGKEDFGVIQHGRCSALFKNPETGVAYYLDAIIWKGEANYDTFSGRVYKDNSFTELIGSSQIVKFPFTPKTFYIDVIRVPVSKEEAESSGLNYIEDGFGECYYTVVKDPKQLDAVFEYYIKK